MAQQTISTGTAANDGTGDPLRTAFIKVNENFTDVYVTAQSNFTQALSGIQAAFNQANTANFAAQSAVTGLTVTNSNSSAYLIDQYSGDNPTVYVSGGETISFILNNVTGHPFMIRASANGTNYNTGLTHVSTTGTVLTGSNAQAQISGTLYWKVPFDLVGSTYVYQCQNHTMMVGNVVIQQPASFVASNTTVALTQSQAAFNKANTTSNTTITLVSIKSLVANSATYADFQTAVANL
jgi:plastocyanin